MNRTQYIRNFSASASDANPRGMGVARFSDLTAAEYAADAKARRIVNTVATLRILIPVALITAMMMSGRPVPDARIDSAMATVAVQPVAHDVAVDYFPSQYTNLGAGGEDHVQNF